MLNESDKKFMSIKEVNPELRSSLQDYCSEFGINIESEEWTSINNKYIKYDYEPFTTNGFRYGATVSSYDDNKLKFMLKLFTDYESKVEKLEQDLQLEYQEVS